MKLFLFTLLNGLTLAALYFLVASGFTLVFGLMRNVNLAHGSLYLIGGYIAYSAVEATGVFLLGFAVAFVTMAVAGIALQLLVFRHMEGQDLRQTMVTIGISIILADLALWIWGGEFYQIYPPDWLFGAATFPIVIGTLSNGDPVYFTYPIVRLFILGMALVIGVLLWLMLNRTRIGMMIRAGVDDREMLSASGINIQLVFVIVFAIGAGLAGIAGVVGSIFSSLAPGEDVRYLLASLVVVIVGGMGSITGAALGAILIGVAEQFGSVYFPTYAIAVSFLIMVAVLAFRPEGIMGARR
ncbi:MAG: branched-chain amino acid ABC transporter permease [Rhodomicrobiaceae bacterium]